MKKQRSIKDISAIKVLIIEDDTADVLLTLEILKNNNDIPVELTQAGSLHAAISILREKSFDLVLMDLGLPDISGIDALRLMLDMEPKLPLIVLTGQTDPDMAAKTVFMGAQDYLVKGKIDGSILYRSIRYAIERKKSQQQLIDSEARFRHAIMDSAFPIMIHAENGEIIQVNHIWSELTGYTHQEVPTIAMWTKKAFGKKAKEVQIYIERLYDMSGRTEEGEYIINTKDGRKIIWDVSSVSLGKLSDGRRLVMSSAEDITDRRIAEEALKKLNERFRIVLNSITGAYFTLDTQWRFVEINPNAEDIFGPAHEVIGKVFWERYPHTIGGEVFLLYQTALMHRRPVHFEAYSQFWDKWHEIHIYPRDEYLDVYFRDITKRKQMEEEIKHRAYHDNLTNLPNRVLFKEVLAIEMANARRNNKKLAILFLDLDRFKEINDAMGHAAGDQLLVEVADRLARCIRRSDMVARIGGDEFNILLSGAENARDISAIATKVLLELREPCIIGGRECPLTVSASIGISIYPDDSEDVDTLFKYADKAMYCAKSLGRNNLQFYSPAMNIGTMKQVELEDELRQALGRGELRVYYQPLVDTASGKIVCAEALLRWQHPKLGLLEPDRFIVLAEKTGLLIPIGEWMIREACMKNAQWQKAGYEPICIAANLSDRQVHSLGLVEMIVQAVGACGLNPRWLELEITENTLIHDPELIIQKLGKLSEYGFRLTMDDFGTGYSSLSYLKQLPIKKIKIDKSFIRDIITDPNDKAIVNAVIAMTHNLSLRVVAEGVETEEQLLFLQSGKCDEIQGYLISKAISADAFEELLASGHSYDKLDRFPKVRHSA